MTEPINQSPDYLRGLSDGYEEGYNAAMKQFGDYATQVELRTKRDIEQIKRIGKSGNLSKWITGLK